MFLHDPDRQETAMRGLRHLTLRPSRPEQSGVGDGWPHAYL